VDRLNFIAKLWKLQSCHWFLDMEVVGLIAALPGLIEIVKGTNTALQGLLRKNAFVTETTELIDQLQVLTKILGDIEAQWRNISLTPGQLQALPPAVTTLREDLTSLNKLIASTGISANGPRLLKRAKLIVSGYEKKLKLYIDRLERSKSSLTLLLVQGMLGFSFHFQKHRLIRAQKAFPTLDSTIALNLKRLYGHAAMGSYLQNSTTHANGYGKMTTSNTGPIPRQYHHRSFQQHTLMNESSAYTASKVVANPCSRHLLCTISKPKTGLQPFSRSGRVAEARES
jgi:hypothetical protein